MIDIWCDQIISLGVIDTRELLFSPMALPIRSDGRFYDFSLTQQFIEYGLWQDLGTGREVAIGNPGDIGREKKRERRRWYSVKYYSSVLRLRDFLGRSLGDEFKSILTDALDADRLRKSTNYYRSKGLG